MSNVGKYVCCGNVEGGFCVAKIVGEGSVNTPEGPKDVFVVEDRICGYPGRMHRAGGRTNLRVEKVNPKTDIFDSKPGMDTMTDEQLFLTMLKGKVEAGDVGTVPMGLANMLMAVQGDGLRRWRRQR